MHMGDESEQEVLVAELAEQPGLRIGKVGIAAAADHDEGMAAAHETGIGPARAVPALAEAIVAVAPLEVLEVGSGVRQGVGIAGWGNEREPHVIGAGELAEAVHREITHERHAVVLELPVAQHARLVRVVRHQGPQQELPVRGGAGGAVPAHEGEVFLPLLVIRHREHPPVRGEPLHPWQAMARVPIAVPEVRVAPPEAEQHILGAFQGKVLTVDLQHQEDDVEVVEEVEVGVSNVE